MGITVSTELSRDQSEEAKPTKTKPTKNQNKDLTIGQETKGKENKHYQVRDREGGKGVGFEGF